MSLYEWLLFLHVLAAFAAVASVVVFGALFLAARGGQGSPAFRLTFLARRLWDVGGAGTLVLGVWLALNVDGYELWDGWILAAFVLWAIAAAAGIRLGIAYQQAGDRSAGRGGAVAAGADRSALVYAVMALATAALLVVMIYKPGA